MKKYIKYFIPPLITTVIILIVYIVKGIYPFGDMTIVHADLGQIFVTDFIYYIDSIKSRNFANFINTNLVYGGSNIFGDGFKFGFFNPFSILYLLFDSKNLVNSISYLLIIKVALSAISAQICFEKLLKNNEKLNIFFSIQYALSSYVLINHTSITWLDIVIMFPLLILSLKDIYDGKKFLKYLICLSICLLANYQLTFMIIFFILATSIWVIRYYVSEDKKKVICNLGIGTILGILLTSVVSIPGMNYFLQSNRIDLDVGYYKNITTFFTKLIYFFTSSIVLLGFIRQIKYFKEDKDSKLLTIIVILTGILPVLFEGINRLWHGGSYDAFPFRYGFIPVFFTILAANYYYYKYFETEYSEKENKKEWPIITILLLIFLSYEGSKLGIIINQNNPAFYIAPDVGIVLVYFIAFMTIIELQIFASKKNRKKYLYSIALIELIIFSFCYIGVKPEYRFGIDHSDEAIFTGQKIVNELRK